MLKQQKIQPYLANNKNIVVAKLILKQTPILSNKMINFVRVNNK